MVAQAYNHNTRVVEAGKSRVKYHPWLHNDSRASLGNRRPTYEINTQSLEVQGHPWLYEGSKTKLSYIT